MKERALTILRTLARRVIQRYRPQVIGVTGSYGKTSAKEAIASVLSSAYFLRASHKSFNNEFGVPFTILGVPAEGSGSLKFLHAMLQSTRLLLFRVPYPTILVLELGADRPGDIQKLLSIVPLSVGVVTGVGPTHLQWFRTVDAIFAEKARVVTELVEHGWGVINADDPRTRTLVETASTRVVTYGFGDGVAVRCLDAAPAQEEGSGAWGMLIKMSVHREEVTSFLSGVIGRHAVYAALAAVAVGVAYHLDLVEMVEGLKNYVPPAGRMRVIPGIKGTMLIDDSYNSSPDACIAALQAVREFPSEGKRYAILGDMAELGAATEAGHRAVGKAVAQEEIDYFVAVGEKMRDAVDEAQKQGMSTDRIFTFDHALDAAKFVQDRLEQKDVVLIKGSQAARMEKATKELMQEPERSSELLVRQGPEWQ